MSGLGEELALDFASDAKPEEPETLASETPIVRIVNGLLTQAIADHASDIHIEPDETKMRVRIRIDGVLHTISEVPANISSAITSRVKLLAGMNIAEHRRPQDGQFQTPAGAGMIDIRVSAFPTIYGENLVLRLLDKSNVTVTMDELGFAPATVRRLAQLLQEPHGILLVTGPTGSGKTTTLYAALHAINSEDVNIITVEDPVEYHLPMIRQAQVNPKAGMTFAAGLRSILRQDPDIIMVGEIRDAETAQITVQAALTGHLVLSTLHTNDASGALTRLIDMGIEPFLVSSSVLAVLAQRLVRRVCDRCASKFRPTPELLAALGLPADTLLTRGKGCRYCRNTGYRGRLGIVELLVIDDAVRQIVMKRSSSSEVANHAISQGMRTLRQDGIDKAVQGLTTIEEVVRATRSV